MTPRALGLVGLLACTLGLAYSAWPEPRRPAPIPPYLSNADVLFVGDCQALGWTYDGRESWALFDGAQNLGLPSYRADHLAADAYRLTGSPVRVIVLQIGTADVSTASQPEEIAADILHAVEALHEVVPDAQVLVLELPGRRDPRQNYRTQAVNLLLRDGLNLSNIGDEWSLPYARWVPLDVEPGPDGAHLDAAGYAAIEEQIGALVHELRRVE